MLSLLLEVFQGFMELLVLRTLLLLLERLNLDLLLEETTLDLGHMAVRLQHLSQEVIRARDWHSRLDKELHSFHDISACRIVAIRSESRLSG